MNRLRSGNAALPKGSKVVALRPQKVTKFAPGDPVLLQHRQNNRKLHQFIEIRHGQSTPRMVLKVQYSSAR